MALGWSDDMLAVEQRLLEMVRVHRALPDRERGFLRGLISGHPTVNPDWENHLAAADRPIDPLTGKPDKTVPRMRPAYPTAKEISRAEEADWWIGRYIAVIETRRVIGCTLVVKAGDHISIWGKVRKLLKAPHRRHSDDTLRRVYRHALADIAAGLRRDKALPAAQSVTSTPSPVVPVSLSQKHDLASQRGGKAMQRKREKAA